MAADEPTKREESSLLRGFVLTSPSDQAVFHFPNWGRKFVALMGRVPD